MFFLIDLNLGLEDGVFLLISLVVVLLFMIYQGQADADDGFVSGKEGYPKPTIFFPFVNLCVGLIALIGGSKLLVLGAIDLARLWEISEAVIGLTIVAVGTSLPELAASLASVIKGKSDMAIGNIIGSNIFNSLGVLAMPALLSPNFFMPPDILYRDVICMVLISTILIVILLTRRANSFLTRSNGFVLTFVFVCYQFLLFTGI